MQCEVVTPDGNDGWNTDVRVRGDHAFVGNAHGVDQIGLHIADKRAQLLRSAANRQGADPLPDDSPQAEAARGGGAGALSRFFECAKRNGDDRESLDREINCTGKCGCDENLVAAFRPLREVTDPV